jgi:hypothetical protein
MLLAGLGATRHVLASVEAEVRVIGADDGVGAHHSMVESSRPPTQSLTWTLERFQRRFGHNWVPGQVVVSAGALEFHTREHDDSPIPLAMRLGEVVAIEAVSKIFSKLVRVEVATGQKLEIRCRTPFSFAEQLQMAAGEVRAAAA